MRAKTAKVHEISLHSIFFGRPGTGKTTVCKIFGSLLYEASALSKGHVVVANQLERIYIQHAHRCTKERHISGKRLLTLTPSDIVPIDVPRPKPHLGF